MLEKAIRERDLRVQWVLARAQVRQERRDKVYQALVKAEPAAPKGLLAVFQQKGHQQALAVWKVAKEVTAKLAAQARRLVERLREIAAPEQLRAWSQAKVEQRKLDQRGVKPAEAKTPVVAVTRAPSNERSTKPAAPRPVVADPQPAPVREPARLAEVAKPAPKTVRFSDLSIEDQVRAFYSITERLQAQRLARLRAVEQKVLRRQQRREQLAERVWRQSPRPPQGMFASFKQKEYEDELKRWDKRTKYLNKLVEQARLLKGRLEVAGIKAPEWADKVVAKTDPGFFRSVQSYLGEQRRMQLEKQRTEQEIKRSLDKNRDRGWER